MTDSQQTTGITRRRFLRAFVGGVAAAVAAALAVPLIGYFLSPTFTRAARRVTIPIAKTSDIPVGIPTFITFEVATRDAWLTTTNSNGAWVVNKNGADFVVYDSHCTHLRCLYYWDNARHMFLCPCHAGVFDIDGKVTAGPPPRPLDKLPFIIDNGTIVLTTA